MPRLAENTSTLLSDLTARLSRVIEVARKEGREEALADLRHLVARGAAPKRGPGRSKGSKNAPSATKPTKSGKKRKISWSGMSAEQRLARVNAIRKGRGLPPKGS